MRVIDWNIKCYCDIEKIIEFLKENFNKNDCIATLQEVMPQKAVIISEKMKDICNSIYSIDYRKPDEEFDTDNRRLGVMILVSKDMSIDDSGVFNRCLFPERTLFAQISNSENETIKVVTFHSLTGVSFKMGKAVQFRSFAESIRDFEPDIITMDANEPRIDHYDIEKMEFFDQGDAGKGAKLFFEQIRKQRLKDAYAEIYDKSTYSDGNILTTSHKLPNGEPRRYDFVFVNDKYEIHSCDYLYEKSVNASSDHAMVITDF